MPQALNARGGVGGERSLPLLEAGAETPVDGPGERNHPGRSAFSRPKRQRRVGATIHAASRLRIDGAENRCAMGRGRAANLPVRLPKGSKALGRDEAAKRFNRLKRARRPLAAPPERGQPNSGGETGAGAFCGPQKPAKLVRSPQDVRGSPRTSCIHPIYIFTLHNYH